MGCCPCFVEVGPERLLHENEDDPATDQAGVSDGTVATEEYDAVVLYDYEAKEAVQLTVYEKDVVRIRKVNQLGWCLALKGDKQGWIPQTYTRRIDARDLEAAKGANTL
mmetsp:Transcript_2550/g.5033  ORF Transcript_2550/g.5033 Transcript_2550/m.5033 type:complete len:109 (-) Transcript_2550:139-465(-)|eukprot:CAMPEP_0167792438 /NCGR_PEP_ID=MMETSP0111_2-20121227/12563_1 /TAXON_ID=91324 /ORGANISM="Lotharella globosa, Strain CCCM811" /LENGTH=108 /DNA_ID=CAMNT_0007685361 /DNA_START=97 /DNA_END=423 /DNA_ORIENTATION=+